MVFNRGVIIGFLTPVGIHNPLVGWLKKFWTLDFGLWEFLDGWLLDFENGILDFGKMDFWTLENGLLDFGKMDFWTLEIELLDFDFGFF